MALKIQPITDLTRRLPRDGLIYALWELRDYWPDDLPDLIRSGSFRAGFVRPPAARTERPHTPGYSATPFDSHS